MNKRQTKGLENGFRFSFGLFLIVLGILGVMGAGELMGSTEDVMIVSFYAIVMLIIVKEIFYGINLTSGLLYGWKWKK